MSTTNQPLYDAAERADAAFSAAIAAHTGGKRNRWTMTGADIFDSKAIRDTYNAKLEADAAWLAHMRAASERRSAQQVAR